VLVSFAGYQQGCYFFKQPSKTNEEKTVVSIPCCFKIEDLNKPSFLLYARITFFYSLKETSTSPLEGTLIVGF